MDNDTTKSAYRIQFEGTFSKMKLMPDLESKGGTQMSFFFLDFTA